MATMKLTNIAHRQRTYLVRDIFFAALVLALLAFEISAFTTAGWPAADAEDRPIVHVTETQDTGRFHDLSLRLQQPSPSLASSSLDCADVPAC